MNENEFEVTSYYEGRPDWPEPTRATSVSLNELINSKEVISVSLNELINSKEWSFLDLKDEGEAFLDQLKATERGDIISFESESGDLWFKRVFKKTFDVKVSVKYTFTYSVKADDAEEAEEFIAYNLKNDLQPISIDESSEEIEGVEEVDLNNF